MGNRGEEVAGREGEAAAATREATRMTVRGGGGRQSWQRFRVRSVVQRRRGARQVNGTMESARERRGEECVCKFEQ